MTTRPWLRSGLESMAIGAVAAIVTYSVGRMFGTS
jgi:VIT1/CCC1 family predicted Fe2+/Mn2+ transporter